MAKDDEIRLTLPAVPEYARLGRLTVAALATRLGFDYDDVEDLRIAVGEVCSLLMETEPADGSVALVFRPSDRHLEIVGTTTLEGRPTAEAASLSGQILEAVADEHETSPQTVRVHKLRARSLR